MNEIKLVLTYSQRLVRREWKKFVLPLLSLAITSLVMMLVLVLTSSSSALLKEQARELQGGDVVLESNLPIISEDFWREAQVFPEVESKQISFTATLQSSNEIASFSVQAVDNFYPLYGQFILESGKFEPVAEGEIYLDQGGSQKLAVVVGDKVSFGESTFTLKGIVVSEPTSLFGGFRFLPRAIISDTDFAASVVAPELLRAEYSYAGKFTNLSSLDITRLREAEKSFGSEFDVDIAGQDRRGLQFGLETVTDFLVVAVLITAVLAAVNVYSSTLYLVTVERKSLAVLLALGMTKRKLTYILGMALFYVVILSGLIGISMGALAFDWLTDFVSKTYLITLPKPDFYLYSFLCLGLIIIIALSSFIPALRQSLSLNPRQILIGGEVDTGDGFPLKTLALVTVFTLLPLVLLAAFLLGNFLDGLLIILAIVLVYVIVAGIFSLSLNFLYSHRQKFNFFFRSIISQKKADGLFGIVSFTSLFVALTALSTLALLQISLESFLKNDLASTVPTTYVLDIQPSQKDEIAANFPDLSMFANISARIVSIDNRLIQEELASPNSDVDRELGREFNITSNADLPSSDSVTQGEWSNGRPGEISVEESFAKRADINLGSKLVFLVQGFEVEGVVTSLRSTDSRSGLPFFYFIFSPEDLRDFPGTYFAFSYYEAEQQKALGSFIADIMPNITIIETQNIGPLVVRIVGTLLVLVLVVTLPPLLIATLLIATLVVSSFASRQREGARMRALGSTRMTVMKQYLAETISLTLVAAVFSYVLSLIITFLVSNYFLELESVVLFDAELIIGLTLIVFMVGLIGLYLFKTDTMPLRELLSYETNQ